MCGIAGFFGNRNPSLLAAMEHALKHRGPDGKGVWYDAEAGVGLAHRRLAIIDLSDAAAQPMSSVNGRYKVIFNGEIYNYREIAKDLQKHNYEFNQNSDTAILGPLYDLHGPGMLSVLNGIFAFAIWDCTEQQLFVARDGMGIKPLYYTSDREGLVFASELKALLAIKELDRSLDLAAVGDYLVHLWTPGERTMFKAVKKLPPGHFLLVNGRRTVLTEWFRPCASPTRHDGVLNLTTELATLFDRVVADQCISDVPVGAFLSGGVDSSAVVAAMCATGHPPKCTYCIGFVDRNMASEGFGDDLAYARLVAKRLDLPLEPIIVKEPQASDLERLVWMLDEPQADPAALYVNAIAAAARQDGIKVLISGAGGDDIFSGYRRHRAAVLREHMGELSRPLGALLSLVPSHGAGSLGRRLSRLGYMLRGTDREFLMRSFEFNRRADVLTCLSSSVLEAYNQAPENQLERALEQSEGAHMLERMLFMELHGFLPDHNLNYTDKASMSCGVEVRVPFLDERLVRFAQQLPWNTKVNFGHLKWLLKKAVAGRLPHEVISRRKTGFGAPVRSWITGRMRPLVMDIIYSRSFRERGVFGLPGVEKLLREVLAGRRDGAYLLLVIVMTELWIRKFRDAKPSETLAQ